MNKKGRLFLIISIALLVILLVAIFLYFVFFSIKDNSGIYGDLERNGQLIDPTIGKSLEEAAAEFDESFVFYFLYNIKAYNLRNSPGTSNTPKIEIIVGETVYNSEVVKGVIYVHAGEIEDEDVRMITSAEEAVRMIRDKNYIQSSFSEGRSRMELEAEKSTLFAKGYLTLYNELTGNGVTGGVIGVYMG